MLREGIGLIFPKALFAYVKNLSPPAVTGLRELQYILFFFFPETIRISESCV